MRSLSVALLGSHLQENLACEYLAAAVERAGHRATFVPFRGRDQIRAAVDRIAALAPDLVGISVPFQSAVAPALELAFAVRAAGFRGHLTCGGHVPTFCHAEILRDCFALDTAVRHEGEETLVEMLAKQAAGEPVAEIAGLVWRTPDGIAVGPARPPVADLDRLAPPKKQPAPFVVSGVPVAFVAASRGCVGDCAYCSIRAFSRDMGGPSLRFRAPDRVADEIAALRRDRGVAIVYFIDDLFFLPREDKAEERLRAIHEALCARGAADLVFCAKARPETITPRVAAAARELGVIHLFLGIENDSPERLRFLGRVHTPTDNRRALALCREHGIYTSFNLLVFDPDATLEDVAKNIALARETLDVPWSLGRTEVHSGTRLLARLAAEGRLEGDFRSFGYRMRDARAEVMFRVLRVAFEERTLGMGSLHNQLTNLSFARQIHEVFFPGPATIELSARVDEALVAVHADTVERLERVLTFASRVDPGDEASVKRFAVDLTLAMNREILPWRTRTAELLGQLNARGLILRGHRG